ncbi:hypothetical protein BDV28DRAFT_145180 [Aspergillus coremiiformis]|uniref:Uncharacterized protein n=1 Tax=Aspergillus coremiiformis TaxID=138285 RepID=A0A5N6ZI81_9EURO|nr:hypothetical protein BDV28DRAFT_145180 [Aspergillus coremiiformis]
MQLPLGLHTLLPLGGWISSLLSESPSCPPLPPGDLILKQYQLYPVNFMWDPKRCVAYVSSLYNATVSIYDPYQSEITDVRWFPGLSHEGHSAVNPLHASGLILRPETDSLEILIDNGNCFYTNGLNVSGPDYLLTMDLNTKRVTSRLRLNEVSNGTYAGYAEAERADDDNTYVVGTHVSNILRVTPDGVVSTFYVAPDLGPPRPYGFTGVAHVPDALLTNDNSIGQLIRFDTRAQRGTPVVIPQTPHHSFTMSYVLNVPARYHGTILLETENTSADHVWGGVGVYRSKDGRFEAVEYLGFIPNPLENSLATAAREMTDRIYVAALYTDGANITVSGHSSEFIFKDITAQVDALVATARG